MADLLIVSLAHPSESKARFVLVIFMSESILNKKITSVKVILKSIAIICKAYNSFNIY